MLKKILVLSNKQVQSLLIGVGAFLSLANGNAQIANNSIAGQELQKLPMNQNGAQILPESITEKSNLGENTFSGNSTRILDSNDDVPDLDLTTPKRVVPPFNIHQNIQGSFRVPDEFAKFPLAHQGNQIQLSGLNETANLTDSSGNSTDCIVVGSRHVRAPMMIGDASFGAWLLQPIFPFNSGGPSLARVPITSTAGMKISTNESPMALDRVYFTTTEAIGVGGPGNPGANIGWDVIGFEKTFLNQRASIGMRLPFLRTTGDNTPEGVGDLSVIAKYVLMNDIETGNIWSVGLDITAPTGQTQYNLSGGNTQTIYYQPWTGYLSNYDKWYVQGFAGLIFPGQSDQTILFYKSLGLGYRLYENTSNTGIIKYFIPTVEGYFTTPLNNRGFSNSSYYAYPDIFSITAGGHLGLLRGLNLTLGVNTPLTGPVTTNTAIIAQLNWLF